MAWSSPVGESVSAVKRIVIVGRPALMSGQAIIKAIAPAVWYCLTHSWSSVVFYLLLWTTEHL